MSHFYGTLKGARGKGTRTGNKSSGMVTECASWNGAVKCHAYYNEELKEDWVKVEFIPWQGKGVECVIYNGPFNNSFLENTVAEDLEEIPEAQIVDQEIEETVEGAYILCAALAVMPLEKCMPRDVADKILRTINTLGPKLEKILGKEILERIHTKIFAETSINEYAPTNAEIH